MDYSKWDKLELSDDEDIEVHPNIDKASWIRFRQAQIHLERRERKDRIASLKMETDMNSKAVKEITQVMESIEKDTPVTINKAVEKIKSIIPNLKTQEEKIVKDIMEMRNKDREEKWAPPERDEIVEGKVIFAYALEKLQEKILELESKHLTEQDLLKQIQQLFGEILLGVAQRQMDVNNIIAEEEKIQAKKLTSDNMYTVKNDRSVREVLFSFSFKNFLLISMDVWDFYGIQLNHIFVIVFPHYLGGWWTQKRKSNGNNQ